MDLYFLVEDSVCISVILILNMKIRKYRFCVIENHYISNEKYIDSSSDSST